LFSLLSCDFTLTKQCACYMFFGGGEEEQWWRKGFLNSLEQCEREKRIARGGAGEQRGDEQVGSGGVETVAEELDEALMWVEAANKLLLGVINAVTDSAGTAVSSPSLSYEEKDEEDEALDDDNEEEEEEKGEEDQEKLSKLVKCDSDDDFGEWTGLADPSLNAFAGAAAGATLWHTHVHTHTLAPVHTQHDGLVPMVPHATTMVHAHTYYFAAAQLAIDGVYDDASFHQVQAANLLFAAGWGEEEGAEGEEEGGGEGGAATAPIGNGQLDGDPELMILVGGVWVAWPPEEMVSKFLEMG